MTKRLSFSLELNANDYDALQAGLANPTVVATAIAPNDPREHARIVDVLVEMAESAAAALKSAIDCER